MAKKVFFFLTFFFLFLGFLLFNFEKPQKIEAAATDNVWGWAWSSNIGWISFNCTSTNWCATSSYGVNINSDGTLSGYTWSEHIGWISFNPPAPYPTCPAPTCPVSPNYSACLDLPGPGQNCDGVGDYKLSGWVQALSPVGNPNAGGWDGWILLGPIFQAGTDYGVWLDTSTGPPYQFKGWAWGSDVVGWISFNCSNENWCSTSTYKVLTSFVINQLPNASNLNQNIDYCRFIPGQAKINLSWTYTDPDSPPNDQQAYSITVEQLIGGSWITKVKCENVSQTVSSGATGTSVVYINRDPPINSTICNAATYIGNTIEYGKNTRWSVSVQDSGGAWSGWETSASFPIDPHAYPWCDFTWIPQKPSVGEIVQFTDQSIVYGGATKSSWLWNFQDGNPATVSNTSSATTTFTSAGSKAVSLRITDSDGYWCEGYRNLTAATINLALPLPKWKEIKP